MFHVVLYQPEIPPNTGNIIRLCANTGSRLHLIEPLGFDMDHAKLRRAGLDYHEFAEVAVYPSLEDFVAKVSPGRLMMASTKSATRYDKVDYRPDDALVFGPETRGLPDEVRESVQSGQRIRLPMQAGVRSLNLSNAVAVVLYEAWRQQGFGGLD